LTGSTRFWLVLAVVLAAGLAYGLVPGGLLPGGLVPGSRSAAAGGDDQARGYDHVWHEGQVSVAGDAPVTCGRCHPMTLAGALVGRPDHATCYGDCHGAAPAQRVPGRPYSIAEESRRQCQTCHTPRALGQAETGSQDRLTVAYPPFQRDPEHSVQMSHALHERPSLEGAGCVSCHRSLGQASAASDVHARCVTCHARVVDASSGGDQSSDATADNAGGAGRITPMDECLTCHVQSYGPRTRPHLIPGVFPVRDRFSHGAHAARETLSCRQCHADVAATDDTELSPPTMDSCRLCHDGDKAFSTTGPHCRACHNRPAIEPEVRAQTLARFDHEGHGVAAAGCDRCHVLDARGRPKPPAADHAPCADGACHRQEFSSLTPKICGVCHVGNEPWRGLHFDRPPRPDTEFGARFSHQAHSRRYGVTRTCADCHRRADGARALGLSRDHDSCMGDGCHAHDSGAPRLEQCDSCHVVGLISTRARQRKRARWTVRARFRHAPHDRDPRTGAALACTACHQDVQRAMRMDDTPTPTKSSCQPCHDGILAFKVTGHGCTRCHENSAL
jgi:c(7)-type cytochrome triheme protein